MTLCAVQLVPRATKWAWGGMGGTRSFLEPGEQRTPTPSTKTRMCFIHHGPPDTSQESVTFRSTPTAKAQPGQ